MIFKTGQVHNPLQIQIHHTLPLILLIKPESVPDSYLGSVNHKPHPHPLADLDLVLRGLEGLEMDLFAIKMLDESIALLPGFITT